MIDLLLNMSEIYARPNSNDVQPIDSNNVSSDESIECSSEPENDENNESVMNVDHSYINSKNLKIIFKNKKRNYLDIMPRTNQHHSLVIETTDEPASSVFDSMSSGTIK